MHARSLTGQPSRRQADSVAKKQATPEKADTIMNVIQKVVLKCPSTVVPSKRLAHGHHCRIYLPSRGRKPGRRLKLVVAVRRGGSSLPV
ncbi:hypothetical protein HPB50_027379 [Hyalomma asiaticum]|uniref:Uncharacterized protein n=1 Tax=Hyalomma asiaticum TaxID=266040 RepID=A0ACB7TP81_HYAAI|nr:hypothetical protein HPB50_027379 [Hyalomma asiaticum]